MSQKLVPQLAVHCVGRLGPTSVFRKIGRPSLDRIRENMAKRCNRLQTKFGATTNVDRHCPANSHLGFSGNFILHHIGTTLFDNQKSHTNAGDEVFS